MTNRNVVEVHVDLFQFRFERRIVVRVWNVRHIASPSCAHRSSCQGGERDRNRDRNLRGYFANTNFMKHQFPIKLTPTYRLERALSNLSRYFAFGGRESDDPALDLHTRKQERAGSTCRISL